MPVPEDFYQLIGGMVVDAACVYEIAARHSGGRWPTFTRLAGRRRTLAYALAAWVAFHLLAEHACGARLAAYRARPGSEPRVCP